MCSNGIGEDHESCIYHEKQSRKLCAVHALNNLFQEKRFTKDEMDSLCDKMAPDKLVNPHRSFIGLGNYDVNVIMAALQLHDMEIAWFDKRRKLQELRLEHIEGFILNIRSDIQLGFIHIPVQQKHWIAVRQIGGTFYNLDSKLKEPELIGSQEALIEFLNKAADCNDTEILVVVSSEVAKSELWISRNYSAEKCVQNGL